MKRISPGPESKRSDHKRLCNRVDDLPEEADVEDDTLSQTQNRAGTSAFAATGEFFVAHTQWTPDQINEHVAKCLEMSTENKITPKNAFALKLIDYLKDLTDKQKDFSTMACSLDAGAKIYSNRVDALHQQVFGLAVDVMISQRRGTENDAPDQYTSASRIIWKKKSIIASNDSITRKLKTVDPKDKYLKVTGLPGAVFCGARLDQADLSLSLENNLPFWPNYAGHKPVRAEGLAALPRIVVVRDSLRIARFDEETNCEAPSEIDGGVSQSSSVSAPEDGAGFQTDQTSADCNTADHRVSEMNHDDSPEDPHSPPQADTGNGNEEGATDGGGNERGNPGEVHILATAMRRLTNESEEGMCPPPTRAEAIRMLFDVNSEYHYLDMNNAKYWAGPDFWTRHQGPPKREKKMCNKRGQKKKVPGLIDFDRTDVEARWNPQMKLRPLSNKTVASWKSSRYEMPKDCKYDSDTFIHAFSMRLKEGGTEQIQSANGQPERSVKFVDAAGTSSMRDVESDNDPFYSSHPSSPESPEDFDEAESTSQLWGEAIGEPNGRGRLIKINVDSESSIDDESLVPAPKMVTVNPIRFRSRPIRVDMRHLKEKMLEVIVEDLNNRETGRRSSFSKLLRELPPRLDRITRDELTPSLAYMALLTLANENELRIKSHDNYKDAIVSRWQEETNMLGDGDIEQHQNGDLENEWSEPVKSEIKRVASPECIIRTE